MAEDRCSHCGQRLPNGNHPAPLEVYSVDEGAHPGWAQEQHPLAADGQRPAMRRAGRWLVPMAVVIGGLVLSLALLRPAAPPSEPSAASGEEPASADRFTEAELERQRDVTTEVMTAELLAGLDTDAMSYGVVYHSNDGLEVLQAEGRTTTDPEAVARFDEVLGYPLLVDGTQTWAVSGDDPTETYIAAPNNILVRTAIDGSYVFLATNDDVVSAGITTQGVSGPLFDLPHDIELLPVQGLGVLYRPATGGTYRIGGLTADLFSEARVLAATPTAWLEQRCEDGITCDLSVHFVDGNDSVPVPLDGNALFSLSPDANWLVRIGHRDDTMNLMDLRTGTISRISAFGVEEIAWSPDSAFFAWLDGNTLGIYQPPGTLTFQGLVAEPYSTSLLITATETTDQGG